MTSDHLSADTAQSRIAEIIAHRGGSFVAPENTLASFRLGWEETTTCELDVQPTRDGKLLVIHDDSTLRTTGVDWKVSEHTLVELQQLDAGSWKGAQWRGERMPALDEAIAAMPDGKRLLIEVKAAAGLVPELARIVRASGKENQLLIHSFLTDTCVEARKAFPAIPVYLLIASRQDPQTGMWAPTIEDAIALSRRTGLSGIGANNSVLVNAAAVEKVHASGLKFNVWTVDDVGEAKTLIEMGVDGVISNRPAVLTSQLGLD